MVWNLRQKQFDDEYKIYTWPCCSQLANKMFVVGKELFPRHKTYTYTIFSKVVTMPEIEVTPISEYATDKLMCYGDIKTVLMLDDCVSCT